MTTHLVTFSDESMSRARALCIESAKRHGADSAYECVSLEKSSERGCGFWRWKPRVIRAAMQGADFCAPLVDGDVLIYSDAGVEFINNVNHIIDRMDQDIFLFANQYEHKHWCKADIVHEIMPEWAEFRKPFKQANGSIIKSLSMWEPFGKQVQASVIFFRVSDYSRRFVKEWLDWCLFEGGRLIDDSPSRTPNHPEFQENRHDQAILTTMAYRDGLKLHWWPAQYNDGAFTYPKSEFTDDYPALFHHHRRRNHEWEAVA